MDSRSKIFTTIYFSLNHELFPLAVVFRLLLVLTYYRFRSLKSVFLRGKKKALVKAARQEEEAIIKFEDKNKFDIS